MILALASYSVQFSTSSTAWPTGSWIHRGFHSCALVFILNKVIPDNISNKKLSCNEWELTANGTVDNVVSYQYCNCNIVIVACKLQYF